MLVEESNRTSDSTSRLKKPGYVGGPNVNRCGTRYDETDYAGPHVHRSEIFGQPLLYDSTSESPRAATKSPLNKLQTNYAQCLGLSLPQTNISPPPCEEATHILRMNDRRYIDRRTQEKQSAAIRSAGNWAWPREKPILL